MVKRLMGDGIFLREWLAANRPRNQLPISAVCNSRCLFCSNDLNPFPIATGFFRDLEEVKEQLCLMEVHDEPIRMSDSLPGRIAEGEAFLHPEFFQILGLLRRKFLTNTLCFTTNGSMLDEPFLKELSRYRPVEINLSMHSGRPEFWAPIFRRGAAEAGRAVRSLPLIRKYGMELVGTIVPLPRMTGWEDIERTYAHFVTQGAKSMILYRPGHTVRTPPEIMRDLNCPIEEFHGFADRMRAVHKIPLSLFPDLRRPLDLLFRRIVSVTLRGNLKNRCGPFRRVLWLTSEAAHGRLKKMVEENQNSFPNLHRLFPVPNRTYGGNIIVSGLLMAEDFIRAGKEALSRWPDTELVLVPKTPFDHLYRDLMQTPAFRIAEELGRTAFLVDDAGNFDPLLTKVFLKARDSAASGLEEAMKLLHLEDLDGAGPEAVLDLVDSYPLQTSWGPLGRDQFREKVREEKARLPEGGRPFLRRFEILDEGQALAVEKWPTRKLTTFNQWTFLRKRDGQWKIEAVKCGPEENGGAGEGSERAG